jgi:hypothetical protein
MLGVSGLRSRVTMRYGASMDLFGYDLDNVADCSEICYSAKGALWACSPRLFSKTGWLGALVNRLTAGANLSTGQGMPMPPQAAPPPSPMPPAAVPQPSFQLPPMANMASNAPNGLLGQLFGGGMPA